MRVEKVGVAREVPPSNSSAQQADTIGLQVDRLRTESDSTLEDVSKLGNSSREVLNIADTAADRLAVSLASPIDVPRSQLGGINPEGKHVHQVALMTSTPLTADFNLLDRSRERLVEDIHWEKGQLAEVMVVENHHQRLMEERWNPATVAVKDVDHAMLDEILREMEELDESHKLSDEDETIIDALLEELEFQNADQDGDERSDILVVEGVPVPCTGVYKVSAECICDVTKATGRSETDIEAEGKCSFQSTEVDCSHERHYCQNPDEVTPQRPALTRRKQFWVSHRKHGRWKHERQQMGLPWLCWPTHRKHGRWKPDKMVMPPLPMQPRPDETRRWSNRRKRSRWKSVNRCSVQRGDTMLRCM